MRQISWKQFTDEKKETLCPPVETSFMDVVVNDFQVYACACYFDRPMFSGTIRKSICTQQFDPEVPNLTRVYHWFARGSGPSRRTVDVPVERSSRLQAMEISPVDSTTNMKRLVALGTVLFNVGSKQGIAIWKKILLLMHQSACVYPSLLVLRHGEHEVPPHGHAVDEEHLCVGVCVIESERVSKRATLSRLVDDPQD